MYPPKYKSVSESTLHQVPLKQFTTKNISRYPIDWSGTLWVFFLRRLSGELCEWSGDDYCFTNRDLLARSMMKNGLLEIVD